MSGGQSLAEKRVREGFWFGRIRKKIEKGGEGF